MRIRVANDLRNTAGEHGDGKESLADMPDIHIASPLAIELETLAIEDSHLQSINFGFLVTGEQFNHAFTHRGSFWVEVTAFDRFVADLRSASAAEAVFSDMDKEFVIHLKKAERTFLWTMRRQSIGDGGRPGPLLQASFSAYYDHFAGILDAFQNYPKWW